jgi:hypothetical protein
MFGFATPPKFMICIYNLQYGILREFLSRVIRSPPLKLIKVLLGQSAHKIEIENMRAHCKTLIKTCNGLISIMKEHYSFHIFFLLSKWTSHLQYTTYIGTSLPFHDITSDPKISIPSTVVIHYSSWYTYFRNRRYSSWSRMIFVTMKVFHVMPMENRVKWSTSGGIGVSSVKLNYCS